MIRMIKIILVTSGIFLCLIFGLQSISIAEPSAEQQRIKMQRHIDKEKIKHPREYQEMVNKAGTIVNCVSCHEEEFKKK